MQNKTGYALEYPDIYYDKQPTSVRTIRRRRRFKLKYQAEPNLSRDSQQYVIAIFNNITSGVIIVINTVCNKHYIIRLINTSVCILLKVDI